MQLHGHKTGEFHEFAPTTRHLLVFVVVLRVHAADPAILLLGQEWLGDGKVLLLARGRVACRTAFRRAGGHSDSEARKFDGLKHAAGGKLGM